MASPYLQIEDITAIASDGGYPKITALSNETAVFLLSACLFLQGKWIWQNPIAPIDETTYQTILDMIAQAEYELMDNLLIGSIIQSITPKTSPNLLLMDGSTVLQADYPELTAVVPAGWLVGADIQLPNMDAVGLFGTTDNADLGVQVGENSVTLQISEIPSHNHTQNPHSHSEIIPAVTPTGAGPIVAGASVVIPTPSTTGFTTASNNPTGGDGAHNNIQNSLQVFYYLIAR